MTPIHSINYDMRTLARHLRALADAVERNEISSVAMAASCEDGSVITYLPEEMREPFLMLGLLDNYKQEIRDRYIETR